MPDTAPRRPPLDEPLDTTRLQVPGLSVEVVEESPSTNALVAGRAREGAPEGLVVVTEHQTAGRGRLDRAWTTPARSALTFSLLLRPRVPAEQWPWLPLLTGHAVAGALRSHAFPAGVKWPNDVLVDDRKVAGILVERVETPTGPAAVLGIGLNVRLPADLLPVPTATSLLVEAEERGVDLPARGPLLVTLLQTLRGAYDDWQEGGDAAADRLRAAYADACVTLGRQVRVELPGADALVGAAVGVDRHGRLLVEPAEQAAGGAAVALSAGDVVHVRPA